MAKQASKLTLAQINANRRLIDELYTNNKISREAREAALEFLYPHNQWGLWISRLLAAIGAVLILSGIVYFFAFNWAAIAPSVKLSAIQIAIFGCVLAAFRYSLERASGQIMLVSASVMVGVFLAVFGQIYQTGADAYQLFAAWALLIFGWTIISNFAAQWILWLVIANIALISWWDEGALPEREMEAMIYVYMAILNGFFLIARERLMGKNGYEWLSARWFGVTLVVATLIILMLPIVWLITEPSDASVSLSLSFCIGLFGHGLAYYYYRFKAEDMWALSIAVLSGCIIVETLGIKLLSEGLSGSYAAMFLLMGIMTIGVFTFAIVHLRSVAKEMEAQDV